MQPDELTLYPSISKPKCYIHPVAFALPSTFVLTLSHIIKNNFSMLPLDVLQELTVLRLFSSL